MSTSPSKRRHRPSDLVFEPIEPYPNTRISANTLYSHNIPDLPASSIASSNSSSVSTSTVPPSASATTPIETTPQKPAKPISPSELALQSPIRHTKLLPVDDGSAKKRRVQPQMGYNPSAHPPVSPTNPPQLDLIHEYLLSPTYARYHQQQSPQHQQQSPSLPPFDVEEIIPQLSISDPLPRVAHQFANALNVNTQVQAYAKLAGANWTYYVKTLRVVVGRSNSDIALENTPTSATTTTATRTTTAATTTTTSPVSDVDIDLSPGKIVSRRHAIIQYDPTRGTWALVVLGRNGVKVDRVSYKPPKDSDGESCPDPGIELNSGSLIDIGGVQMIFVLPNVSPIVAPGVLKWFKLSQHSSSQQQPTQPYTGLNFGTIPVLDHSYTYAYPGYPPSLTSPQRPTTTTTATTTNTATTTATTSALNDLTDIYAESPRQPPPAYVNHTQFLNSSPSHPYVARPIRREVTEPEPSSEVNTVAPTAPILEDLSSDEYKDIKPPYSYATMITQAILSNEEEMISLAEIYEHIAAKYSFYRHSATGWQNSIRHNLSLNKAFEKVPRRQGEPGKGMKWKITPQHKDEYLLKLSYGELEKRNKGSGNYQRQLHLGGHKKKDVPESKEDVKEEPQQQQQQQQQQQLPPPPIVFKVESDKTTMTTTTVAPLPTTSTPQRLGYIETYADQYGLPVGTPLINSHNSLPGQTPISSIGRLAGSIASTTLTMPGSTDTSSTISSSSGGINGTSHILRSASPSPTTQRYRVSQLEAFTPDRGSNATQLYPFSLRNNNKSASTNQGQLAPPSSFMPNSSPAPFWRFMHMNSPYPNHHTSNHNYNNSNSNTPGDGEQLYKSSIGGIGGGLGLYNDISPVKYPKAAQKVLAKDNDVMAKEDVATSVSPTGEIPRPNQDKQFEANDEKPKASNGRLGDLQNVDLTRGFRSRPSTEGEGDEDDEDKDKDAKN